jgi:tRNA threonylcarbamoyladenosine biosynthesis protein TsaE
VAEPGLVIALVGPLGAGKTLFVRAVAEGLDIADSRLICSPTFVLMQEYTARLPIYHFDTYRLTSPAQFAALGPEEYFEGDGVCLVEWADRVTNLLPADLLTVRFIIAGPTDRELLMHPQGECALRVLTRLWPLAQAAQGVGRADSR